MANTDSDDTDLPPETAAVEPKGPRKVVTPIAGPESFADRLRPHIKKIAAGAGALAVVLGLFYTWRWMKNRKAASHTGDLAGAVELGQRPVLAPDPAKPVDPTKPAPVDEKPPYPSVKARAEAVLDQLDNAGGLADADPLYHAALLMDAGRLDEAAAIYAAHAGDAGLIGVRAREGQGYAIEARAAASKDSGEQQKLLEQALTVFKTMQPDDKGARADYAHYHIGRLLAQLNRTGEAKAELDKALELVPESEIKGDITARRALVEVQ